MAKIYTDQALSLSLTFVDQAGTIINITGGTITAELYAPSNTTEVADITVSGSVVSGVAGTASANIAKDILGDAGQWRIQPRVTLSGTPWPAKVFGITVTKRGSLN